MSPELEAIRTACRKTSGDLPVARRLSTAYVTNHPEQFTELAVLSREECVTAAAAFSAAGRDEDQWKVEAWLLHLGPQPVTGELDMVIELPGFQ